MVKGGRLLGAAVMLSVFFLRWELTLGSENTVQSTLPPKIWKTLTCVEPSETVLFTINMGVDECDITQTSFCSVNLIHDGFLRSVCSASDDSVTYTCDISSTYTEPVCCMAYTDVNQSLLSRSCFTNTSHVTTISPGPTPNRTLIVNKRELSDLEKGLIIGAAVIFGIVVFGAVVVVAVVVGGYCRAVKGGVTVRQGVREEDGANLPVRVEINVFDAQNERKVPPGESDAIPYYFCPVQERVKEHWLPGSATHWGNQSDDDQSGVQNDYPPSFVNQMGLREEDAKSNVNPDACMKLPDTPVTPHGSTQPINGSPTREFVFPQPMHNTEFLARFNMTSIVLDESVLNEASQVESSLGFSATN